MNPDGDRKLTNLIFGDTDTGSAGSWILDKNKNDNSNLILAGATPNITVNALGTNKTTTISAIIEGTDGLTKGGTGTLVRSGNNSYTGATTVSAGTLLINGDQSAANGGVTVASGATLGGSGAIGGDTFINGGIHAPGNSPGVLSHVGNLTYAASSTGEWELTQNNSSTALQSGPSFYFDQIAVNGNLNFAGATRMNLTFNSAEGGALDRWSRPSSPRSP